MLFRIKYIYYLLLIASIANACLLLANNQLIKQQYAFNLIRKDPTIFNLIPEQLRNVLAAGDAPQHWCIILVKNQHLGFYSNYTSQHWLNKQQHINNTLVKIIESGHTIPDGYYAFSMEDGIHSQYNWPLLAFASDIELAKNKNVILIPDFEAMQGYESLFKQLESVKHKLSWQDKKSQIFWRGNASGASSSPDQDNFPRLQLMQVATKYPHIIDAKFTNYPKQTNVKLRAYLDKHFPVHDAVATIDALQYKYLIDVDGYSCSYSRMAWILYSNSLLLKHQSTKQQWYYHLLQPFVHYIPIKNDFSDIEQQYTWAQTNPAQVQKIIANAQQLAKNIFSETAIEQATLQALMDYHALTQS